MSDYHETSLRRHEEELDRLYQEEYERQQDPVHWWCVVTTEWTDYAYSEEEKNELIQAAKDDGLQYGCTLHVEGEKY
jgi:hypothetical protein